MKFVSIATNIVLLLRVVYLTQLVALVDAANARAASTSPISAGGGDKKDMADIIKKTGSSRQLRHLKKSKKPKKKKKDKKCKDKKDKKKNKKNDKKKDKKDKNCNNDDYPEVLPSSCFLLNEGLGENETAPVSSEDCGALYDSLETLQDDTFARDDFADFFDKALVQGINEFILNQTSPELLANITAEDYANTLERLEEFIFEENVTLNDSDFSALLAFNYMTTPPQVPILSATDNQEIVDETPEDINAYLQAVNYLQTLNDIPKNDYSVALPTATTSHNGNRKLIDDSDLTPECLDVIIRIVVEVIGLLLTGLGIRGIVTRPFKEHFVMLKGGQLNGLVLSAYRQSRGEFDFGFFAGLVVSFLSILTWKDIKSALDDLKSFDDWFSLCLGLLFAIGSVLLTSGLAVVAATVSILLQANSLKDDILDLGKCFALCSDGYTQSGGQSTQTFIVALDRSQGELTLSYEMYRIPDQLELIYEDSIVYTTGGLVSGSQTISRTIDGDAEEILVKITAPNSGTAWRFTLDCPIPSILRI